MKIKYYSDLLLKNLRKTEFDDVIDYCKKENLKINFSKDSLHIKSNNSIYFVGVIKIDDNYYYSINQLSKYKDNNLKDILIKIKNFDNLSN